VVIGEVIPETLPVFVNAAAERNSTLTIAAEKRKVTDWKWDRHHLIVEVEESHHVDRQLYELDLAGLYQRKNLLTVLESCTALRRLGWTISDHDMRNGLKKAKKLTALHGRWEVIMELPLFVLDVAHNEDGIRELMKQVELTDHDQLHIVIGMVRDKDLTSVLSLLPKHAVYYFTRAQIPRAMDPQTLQEEASRSGLSGEVFETVDESIHAVYRESRPGDMVLVCGSIFVVAEINPAAINDIWKQNSFPSAGIQQLP
jgi:dihydrofolate synthase/folylpolyglutamate synthase